jgi:hypothetical protein
MYRSCHTHVSFMLPPFPRWNMHNDEQPKDRGIEEMYILSELSLARKHNSKRMHTVDLCTYSHTTTCKHCFIMILFELLLHSRYSRLSQIHLIPRVPVPLPYTAATR